MYAYNSSTATIIFMRISLANCVKYVLSNLQVTILKIVFLTTENINCLHRAIQITDTRLCQRKFAKRQHVRAYVRTL